VPCGQKGSESGAAQARNPEPAARDGAGTSAATAEPVSARPNRLRTRTVRLDLMPEMHGSGWRSDDPRTGAGSPLGPASLEADGDWKSRFMRWIRPLTMGAVGMSLLIHLVLWAIAAFVLIGGGQAGGAGEGTGNGTVGVAVMTEAEFAQMPGGTIEADAPAVAEAPAAALPGGEADIHVTDALPGGGGTEGGLGEGIGKLTSGGAGDISGGPGLGGGGAGGGAASFFGVEARGTRFAYVIDISGSMDLGVGVGSLRRIDIMKTELGKSLGALMDNAKFFVALFSGDSKPMGGKLEWVSANESGKQWARRTVPLIAAEGETIPVPAFKLVLQLRPRPDAIYFMTDGEFDKDYANQIARMNVEFRIPIHCITFVSKEGEEVMRKIAADSGGTYTHVPGPGG
jgi:hypothetical protein